jgi:hypothetical protein
MAGSRRGRRLALPRAGRFRVLVCIVAVSLLGAMLLAQSALAGSAADQYKLHQVAANGGRDSGTKIGDEGGGVGLPLLILVGAAVACGGGAFVYVRWRRRPGQPA